MESKIVSKTKVFQGKWLGMNLVEFSIGDKPVQKYETVFCVNKKFEVYGVDVVPIIKRAGKKSQIVLIANYRPPIENFSLQFPAGLTESADFQENARREVKEETGYVVDKFIKIPQPMIHCSPWTSDETSYIYIGIINGDDPNSLHKQQLDAGENISVHLFDLDSSLPEKLAAFVKERNYAMENKVWGVCLGFILGSMIE